MSTQIALARAVKIGGWDLFTGSTIGAYLGSVPTYQSFGAPRSLGSIERLNRTTTDRVTRQPLIGHLALDQERIHALRAREPMALAVDGKPAVYRSGAIQDATQVIAMVLTRRNSERPSGPPSRPYPLRPNPP